MKIYSANKLKCKLLQGCIVMGLAELTAAKTPKIGTKMNYANHIPSVIKLTELNVANHTKVE